MDKQQSLAQPGCSLPAPAAATFSGGEWLRKNQRGGFLEVHTDGDDDDTPICTVHIRRTISGDRPNAEANLALISAAPNLYRVLDQWVTLWTRYKLGGTAAFPMVTEEHEFILECAKAALAKARGTKGELANKKGSDAVG